MLVATSCLRTPSIQWDISEYPFLVVETRENVLTGHKAKSPDIEQTAGKTSSVFNYIEDHSKVCLNRHQSGENHGLTSLYGWLESGFIGLMLRSALWFFLIMKRSTVDKDKVTIYGRKKIPKSH